MNTNLLSTKYFPWNVKIYHPITKTPFFDALAGR